MVEDSCQAKVSEFDILLGIQENVGWFKVAVQNCAAPIVPPMALFESQGKLCQHPQDMLLL